MSEIIVSPNKLFKNLQIYILLFTVFSTFYITVNFKYLIFQNMSTNLLVASTVIGLMLIATLTIVHELSHLVAARLLKQPCNAHVFKKFVDFPDDLPKREFIIIALAPLVVHLCQILIFAYFFPYNFTFIISFTFMILVSCMSDGYLVFKAMGYDESNKFRYKAPGVFEVIST